MRCVATTCVHGKGCEPSYRQPRRATPWRFVAQMVLVLSVASATAGHAALAAAPETPPADPAGPAPAAADSDSTDSDVVPAAESERANRLLALGQLREAATAWSAIAAAHPSDLRAHERLRQTYIRLGGESRAALADVSAQLVRIYIAANDTGMAQARLDEVLTLQPEHPQRAALELAVRGARRGDEGAVVPWTARARSLFGMLALLAIAFVFSKHRRHVRLRPVLWGMALQWLLAVVVLWTPPGRWLFEAARQGVNKILSFTDIAAGFLFGKLYQGIAATQTSGPVQVLDGTTGDPVQLGMIFAFHVLPTIVFFGALMSILYHYGIIQRVIKAIAWVMSRTMGTTGAESLSAASNIFVGQTEAPLVIKPYLPTMTMSELTAVMCAGFATVAGGVLAAYTRLGFDAGHLLAASVMSAPAALVIAKLLYPETETPQSVSSTMRLADAVATENVIDAAAAGATDGLKLALNVGAMLLAFVALVAMVNWLLGFAGLSLAQIFGWAFYPVSWLLGIDGNDLMTFGKLLGTKISINEFVAYVDLAQLRGQISERTFRIGTYALCGFANFASIGIQIGGISAIAPDRRSDLAKVGLRAMFGGAIASWLTACIAGVLV